MRLNLLACFGMVIAVLLYGCISQPGASTPQPSIIPLKAFDQTWLVNLIVTGGFDGIERSVEVSSGGDLRVIDDRSGKQVLRYIPATDLAEISRLISEIVQLKNEIVPPCADCFVYQIFIRRDNSMFSTTLNDVNLEESGLLELINLLMGLGNDALAN